MSQVIIVSNRLPVSVKKKDGLLEFTPSVGGLATGLSAFVTNRKHVWIGWPGIASDELNEEDKNKIVTELAKHHCSPVFLTKKQLESFYSGYSNSILWPLFHQLPLDKVAKDTYQKWWRSYRTVNKLFSDAVLGLLQPDSRIWVHDYQLMLLPQLLRQEEIAASIGFFLHIPFPPRKTLNNLKENQQLLKGVLGADLIGFHTSKYVSHFLFNCQEQYEVSGKRVLVAGRQVRVSDFPMGIDYAKYSSASATDNVKAAAKRYRKRYRGKKVIAAVDRLDPSKGLVERLKAYRELLARNPKLHKKVVFSMIAAPSRTDVKAYQKLATRLDTLVDEINDSYGTARWQPVEYTNTSQPFEEVAALFSVADVAFIAPLRDGMNLTAKEFVASKNKSGVLVLSETAGAAEELHDALLVNPWRPGSLVDGLQSALKMSKRELRSRLRNMQRQLAKNTVQAWAKDFLETLQQPIPGSTWRTRQLSEKSQANIIKGFGMASSRLFLFDYDGTLTAFTENYKHAKPSSAVLKILSELASDKKNEVVLISGRSAANLEEWFGSLKINLVAEHGALIKKAGSSAWHVVNPAETKWKAAIQPILEKYTEITPGAQLEIKPRSLVWHYRGVSAYYAQKHIVIIKRVLKPIVKTYGLKVFHGNKILEVKDPRISKGATALRWLRHKYDFVLALGDDFTDEEMFKVLPSAAFSIKIGTGKSAAKFRLPSPQKARRLINRLARF